MRPVARFDRERVRDLEHGEEVARVAFALVDEMLERVVVDLGRFVAEAAFVVVERAARRARASVVVVERLEPEERAAREQRTGEREERVLGGRADEHEQTLLDEREQHVLLGAGEAVHLVEEEDRALAALAEPGPGPFGDLAHVLHARAHRAERLERLRADARDEAGDGGLAGAGRTPEHDRRQPVGLDEDPQRLARPEQVLLADDLVERPGPQPRRERRPVREPLLHRRREQIRPPTHARPRLRPQPHHTVCKRVRQYSMQLRQTVCRHSVGRPHES